MKTIALFTSALFLAFSLNAQEEKKSEIHVKIEKDGKVVKDTTYLVDEDADTEIASKILDMSFGENFHKGEHRVMAFASDDGELHEFHSKDGDMHAKHKVMMKEMHEGESGHMFVTTEEGEDGETKVIASSKEENFSYIPADVEFSEGAAYAHITSNNTLYGTEWNYEPKVPSDVPLVCDMSSDIMAREINAKDYGVIYAGAQKNLGPAGVTLVIVREDLIGRVPDNIPTMQKWSTHVAKGSMFNTPPVFPIYMCKLALEHLKEMGGVKAMEKLNREKAKILYDVIDASDGFYKGHARADSRSLMNVTFTMATPELENKCVDEAIPLDLIGLKGHRSVGGMRASIYNAMPIEGVKKLAEYLTEFKEKHQ